MNVLERFRRFWRPGPGDDHPLTAQERDEDRPATAYVERAPGPERLVAGDFDPDETEPGRTD